MKKRVWHDLGLADDWEGFFKSFKAKHKGKKVQHKAFDLFIISMFRNSWAW